MDYFIVGLDSRLRNAAKPIIDSLIVGNPARNRLRAAIPTCAYYVDDSRHNEYPDYLGGRLLLVSEKLKSIMSFYQKNAIFKPVVLIEKNKNRHENYYQTEVSEVQYKLLVPEKLGYDPKNVVLDQEVLGYFSLFYINYYGKRLVVRLDLAESILRRDSYAVTFKKVVVTTKEEI